MRAGSPAIRPSAASTNRSLVWRGEKTRPGSVTNVNPWKRVLISSSTT
jgi:hypothetical protein